MASSYWTILRAQQSGEQNQFWGKPDLIFVRRKLKRNTKSVLKWQYLYLAGVCDSSVVDFS